MATQSTYLSTTLI